MDQTKSAAILESKEHYHVLDGLRGIAALAVVLFHYMEWMYPPAKNFIGHGFLAVDFFFCLSGFVIGYAYDGRLAAMGRRAFFISRLIRLHPMVMAGTVLAIIGLYVDPFTDHTVAYSGFKLLLVFVSSFLLIPYPVMEERGFNLFSLNAPAWSLFWEYIANLLYAFILVRLSKKVLWILLVPAAAAILWISHRADNLMGGWSGGTFADGGIRMLYSFLAGLVIYRSGWIIKNKLGFWVLSVLLVAAFIMPWFSFNWIVEAGIVLVYFPLLVSLGAGSVLATSWQKLCIHLGNLSYPLYMTHYAGIWVFGSFFLTQKPAQTTLVWTIIIGMVIMVLFAWLVMRFYDMPLRKYLNRKRNEKLARQKV